MKKYRQIEHTADFGIHVFGSDPRDLFSNAAHALFDLVTDIDRLSGSFRKELVVAGDDWPDLMINWLRELLYFWTGRERLVKSVEVLAISENRLTASIIFDPYDAAFHLIKQEIKAVTYHQLQVTCNPKGWESKIIFDV